MPKDRTNFPGPKFQDKESLSKALLSLDLTEDGVGHIVGLARHGLHLVADDTSFSKIGGAPELPPGMAWPMRPSILHANPFTKSKEYPYPQKPFSEARSALRRLLNSLGVLPKSWRKHLYYDMPQPFHFIAQISFEEMGIAGTEDFDLPEGGALYLFYDAEWQPWGYENDHALGFKVIYVPDIENAAPVARPDAYDDMQHFDEQRVKPELHFDISPPCGLHFESLPISKYDEELYRDYCVLMADHDDYEEPAWPAHKVGGWANHRQNPMEDCCVDRRAERGGAGGHPEVAGQALSDANGPDGSNDWVLLLQVDSDNRTGMSWGDSGRLYLWIKKSDLKRGDFDNTWLILQC